MSATPRLDLLQIPGLVVKDVQADAFNYLIIAELEYLPERCPACDSDAKLKRGNKTTRTFRDTTVHDKKCRVEVHRRYLRCGNHKCSWSDVADVPGMEPGHSMTRRLATHIRRESLSHPFRRVAADVGCNEATVRKLFHSHLQQLNRLIRFETPEWLGIDEVMIHGKYLCIVTNLHRRTVVAVLEDKSSAALHKYLSEVTDPERIRLISTDMDKMYHKAVHRMLPHATIVLDRFHIVARATQAVAKLIDDVRRAEPQSARVDALKVDKWALLKRSERVLPEQLMLVDMWQRSFPAIGQACAMLQEFYRMWDECQTKTALEAREAFKRWRKKVKDLSSPQARDAFNNLLELFRTRPNDIFSYFGTRLTNAYTEQANRRIRDINRSGRGYRFEVLRAKILYGNIFRLGARYQRPGTRKQRLEYMSGDYWSDTWCEWQRERAERYPAPPEHIYRHLPKPHRRVKKNHLPLFAEMDDERLRLIGEEFTNFGVPMSEVFDDDWFDEEVA